MITKPGIEAWRAKIGEEEANKISGRAARRGTKVHGIIEKYLRGDENYLRKETGGSVMQDHKELVLAGIPQIDARIDNIRGIEMSMWSDHLKVAGTADLVADYNGELAVIDWKTGSYIKKDQYVFHYILQGAAYCHMLAEMYKLVPKKIVICTFIRFNDPKKPVPFMDGDKVVDLLVEWKEYDPNDYVEELIKVCNAYHFSKR
jgi:genome maintenance exonuclease 1